MNHTRNFVDICIQLKTRPFSQNLLPREYSVTHTSQNLPVAKLSIRKQYSIN